jgi:hypothetical protein
MREGRRTFFKRKQKLDKLFNWTVASWFDVHRAKLNHVDELLVRVGGGGVVRRGKWKPKTLLPVGRPFVLPRRTLRRRRASDERMPAHSRPAVRIL